MAKPIFIPDSPARNNRTAPPPGAADTADGATGETPMGEPPMGEPPIGETPLDETPLDESLGVVPVTRAVGRRLAALRRERGLTQEALGWRAGYHRTHISQIERGSTNPTLVTLFNIVRALDLPLAALCAEGRGPGAAQGRRAGRDGREVTAAERA